MKKIPILAALILLLISLTTAEEWMSFTTADGLAHDKCQCVAVDHDGNVWVGHGDAVTGEGGVSMWDGETWTTYFTWTTDFGLRSNYINDIAVDQDNNIWFGTGTVLYDGGLTKFDGENWERICYDTLLADTILTCEWINAIYFDTEDKLHAGNCNLFFIGQDSTQFFFNDDYYDLIISDIIVVNDASYLCGDYGLVTYDGISFTEQISGLRIIDMELSSDGIWMASRSNIIHYNFSDFYYFDTTSGLPPSEHFQSVYSDGYKTWIGNIDGLILLDSIGVYDYRGIPESPHSHIYDIKKDSNENLLMATSTGFYILNNDSITWFTGEDTNFEYSLVIDCYPNPFHQQITIKAPHAKRKEIYDISGRLIEVLEHGQDRWQPKGSLSNGIYLITAKIENKTYVKKIYLMR